MFLEIFAHSPSYTIGTIIEDSVSFERQCNKTHWGRGRHSEWWASKAMSMLSGCSSGSISISVSRPAGRHRVSEWVSGPFLCSWAAGVGHWVPYILNPASAGRRTGCKPNSDHCQLTHFMPCRRIIVVHCRQMGRDRRLPPFQGPVNLGLLNSATPMNGLLSKDTPDLSNNELSLICSGKYNTTNGGKYKTTGGKYNTTGGKGWSTDYI